MPEPSSSDRQKLNQCHEDIRLLFLVVLRHRNAVVASTYRGEEEQNQLYREGKSQVKYPESMHNKTDEDGNPYSHAADVYPVIDGEVPWGDDRVMAAFAGYVLGTADQLDIDVINGADWDKDWDYTDTEFFDWGHFALPREE